MFELSSLMARIVARPVADDEGNPTDDAVISISRLHQFMRPIFFHKKTESGFEIRLEWLGYCETGHGDDVFAVEGGLGKKVLKHIWEDSKQLTLHRNL